MQDCRAQSYDSASNVSGGLQARIKCKTNSRVAHSLNLIAEWAARSNKMLLEPRNKIVCKRGCSESSYAWFKDALNKIFQDNIQKASTKVEAQGCS